MSTPTKMSIPWKKVGMAFVVSAALAGIVLYCLINFEYSSRHKVYNALGLNPTVKWVGQNAPPFVLQDLRSPRKVALKEYRGKVVLLDFWATWCPPCRRQLPIIQRLHGDPKLKKMLQVLTINMKEAIPPMAVLRFLKQRKWDFPVLQGTPDLVKKYKIWFFPVLVIIAPNGKVFYSAAELHDEARIRALILEASKARG